MTLHLTYNVVTSLYGLTSKALVVHSSPPWITHPHHLSANMLSMQLLRTTQKQKSLISSLLQIYYCIIFLCSLPYLHMSLTRRHLTLCLMVIQICQWNHPLLWSFPTVPTFQLIPACGMATLWQLLSSKLTNFFIAMCVTQHTCCNTWHAFSSKEALLDVMVITLHNLNYLENLYRTLFLLSSNLGGINYTHPVLPLSGIMSKLILATSRTMIIIPLTTPPLRKLSTKKSLL